MKQLINSLPFGIMIVVVSAFGQDTLKLSRTDLSTKLAEQNLQLKISNQTFESARSDYRQSNALFLPSISASHTAITTTNPLMAFGSKLNQEILTQADFNPALLNDPSQVQNYATRIEVLQPIFNADGLYERRAAKSKMEAYQLQTERTKEYLELEVNKAFMQLQLAYKAVGVVEKANSTAQANLNLVNNYFKQGMLQKTDLLDVQVRVNEITNQLSYAKSNVRNASDYLAFLLNEDTKGGIYKPVENLENEINPSLEMAQLSASRKDFLAMEKSTEAYRNMMTSGRMSFLPRLNAFGTYELYDTEIFQFGANGYTVGAQLSWNLFDGYKSIGKFEKSKVEFQKAETEAEQYKKQSQLELNKTNRQLADAQNKVALSKLAFEQTQESFRIRQNRFTQGLEKTTDLLMTETQTAQKELEYLQAVFEYNFTKMYIEFLTK
ncbi:TolC family protein [Flavobacterium lacus]|uniref:Outer membrane protein TolC n=1 Tax=Flavobacterium lacus TaxID=1353778 RepID=A0A328X1C6_9FLAO|nr:TolC family protein [Flavobacterium lacus]RAR49019.1 outer membrane protein TolC [Flavobacterium lacus]